MKKLILVAALMLSTHAFADGYEQTQIKFNYCESVGQTGQHFYVERIQGTPRETAMDSFSSVFAEEKKHWLTMSLFAVTYAYDSATSEKDAYMRAFAHCMDEVSN